jgi:hypothetical protein
LAATWQDARDLQRLATQAGVILETGLILRYESSHRWLHQQIAEGAFGDLVSLMARCSCSRSSFAAIADRIHSVSVMARHAQALNRNRGDISCQLSRSEHLSAFCRRRLSVRAPRSQAKKRKTHDLQLL